MGTFLSENELVTLHLLSMCYNKKIETSWVLFIVQKYTRYFYCPEEHLYFLGQIMNILNLLVQTKYLATLQVCVR